MASIFSDEWMGGYKDAWNASEDVSGVLSRAGFNAVIGVGYPDDEAPAVVVTVEDGVMTGCHGFDGDVLDWDLRAEKKLWEKWMDKGVGMMGLGAAVTTGNLKFRVGDYGAMIKEPSMTGPFVKSFGLMNKLK
jgi:hypothetical protein